MSMFSLPIPRIIIVSLFSYLNPHWYDMRRSLFFLREVSRERERERKSRKRGRRRISSRLHAQCGAQCGAQTHDPEIVTQAEIKSQMLKWLSHPGSPRQEKILRKESPQHSYEVNANNTKHYSLRILFWKKSHIRSTSAKTFGSCMHTFSLSTSFHF